MAAYVRFISDNYYTRKRLVTKIQNYQPFCKHFYCLLTTGGASIEVIKEYIETQGMKHDSKKSV